MSPSLEEVMAQTEKESWEHRNIYTTLHFREMPERSKKNIHLDAANAWTQTPVAYTNDTSKKKQSSKGLKKQDCGKRKRLGGTTVAGRFAILGRLLSKSLPDRTL